MMNKCQMTKLISVGGRVNVDTSSWAANKKERIVRIRSESMSLTKSQGCF
jgi:hypothetical protein